MEKIVVFAGKALTKPCDVKRVGGEGHSHWCKCNGTGFTLTPAGEKLVQFLKDYGPFAEKDHTHRIE